MTYDRTSDHRAWKRNIPIRPWLMHLFTWWSWTDTRSDWPMHRFGYLSLCKGWLPCQSVQSRLPTWSDGPRSGTLDSRARNTITALMILNSSHAMDQVESFDFNCTCENCRRVFCILIIILRSQVPPSVTEGPGKIILDYLWGEQWQI